MATITFDTFKFVKTLTESGLSEPQAEIISSAMRQAYELVELATKSDISKLNGDIARLNRKLDTIKWVSGFIATGMIGLLIKVFS